ncbi:MAG: hypothetical protein ACJ8CR_07060, partial [Roseiflexaceae bacterium]
QFLESKYDQNARTVTLDTSFGDQVTALLALLNMQQIALTDATLTPPKGTTPAPAQSSLLGTATIWGVPQGQFQLAISAGAQDAAQVTVTSSLPSIPIPTLAQYVLPMNPEAAAGLDTIHLTDVKLTAAQPAGTMVVSAGLADGWSPFGLQQVYLEKLQFKLAVLVGDRSRLCHRERLADRQQRPDRASWTVAQR